jgi:carbon storage regulator
MIGDDIQVIVVAVNGMQVKLGIDAPKDVPVNREEIHDKLKSGGERFVKKGASRETE